MDVRNTSVPVVILNMENAGLGILRSMGRLGVSVFGVYINERCPSVSSRYCRKALAWPFHTSSTDQTVAFLLELARNIGRPSILVPTCDDTAMFAAEQYERLREWYVYPHPSPKIVRSLSSKKEMYEVAVANNVPTPAAAFPKMRADVEEFASRAVFPVMVKGIDGLALMRRAGKRMTIAHDQRELLQDYDTLEDPAAPNLMLQEYIPGGDDTIWMFNGYFDRNSDCLAGFTGKKIRQYPVHTGATSLGILLPNPAVEATTKRLMKAVGYTGILDIGYRYDARDGTYKVLDINARIGGTFRLFLSENGLDVMRAMYLDMNGEPVPPALPIWGRKWITELSDLKSCLDYRREGKLSLLDWINSYRGVQEGAFFAWDDLMPFSNNILGTLFSKLRRLFRARFGRRSAVEAKSRLVDAA